MRKPIPKKVKDLVKLKFQNRCGYCGEKKERLCIDHIIPWQRTQDDSIGNLMPACQQCNNYKLAFSLDGFRMEIQESVRKARQRSVNFRFAEKYGLIEIKETKVMFYFEKESK